MHPSIETAISRLYDPKDAKVILQIPDADIRVDEETGTVFFRYRSAGIAFHPKTGSWSTPLEFGEVSRDTAHASTVEPEKVNWTDEELGLT